jgi:hypothetical protein
VFERGFASLKKLIPPLLPKERGQGERLINGILVKR